MIFRRWAARSRRPRRGQCPLLNDSLCSVGRRLPYVSGFFSHSSADPVSKPIIKAPAFPIEPQWSLFTFMRRGAHLKCVDFFFRILSMQVCCFRTHFYAKLGFQKRTFKKRCFASEREDAIITRMLYDCLCVFHPKVLDRGFQPSHLWGQWPLFGSCLERSWPPFCPFPTTPTDDYDSRILLMTIHVLFEACARRGLLRELDTLSHWEGGFQLLLPDPSFQERGGGRVQLAGPNLQRCQSLTHPSRVAKQFSACNPFFPSQTLGQGLLYRQRVPPRVGSSPAGS